MSDVLVSLIVPIYNVEDYLAECLDSILGQTYKDIQVILVDDGSTDHSYNICKDYQTKDERIKIMHKENGGLASSRNAGLQAVEGEWVGFIDSDDVIEPDFVEKMLLRLRQTGADVAVCGFERYDDGTGKVYKKEMMGGTWNVLESGEFGEMLYVNPGVCNKLFNANLFHNVRFVELRLAEDLIFTVDLLEQMPKFVRVKEVLYHYRVRNGSIINTVREDVYLEVQDTLVQRRKSISEDEKDYMMLIDAMVFLHIGVSLTVRLAQGNKELERRYIKNAKNIMDNEFPGWRRTKYLSFVIGLKKGVKGIGLWGCRLLYKWNLFIIFVKFYRFLQEKLHKDIKW